MLSFFPRDVLDEILNLIESVSGGFPSFSINPFALRMAKTPQSFGHFECNRVKMILQFSFIWTVLASEGSFNAHSNSSIFSSSITVFADFSLMTGTLKISTFLLCYIFAPGNKFMLKKMAKKV